jgi:hypothetical protein
MDEIVFECPVGGTGAASGIFTDPATVDLMSQEEISLRGPRCGFHTWQVGDGRLSKRTLPS